MNPRRAPRRQRPVRAGRGAHLVDPDLIRPGWELTIPGTALVQHDPVEPPGVVKPPVDVKPPHEPRAEQPTTEATPGPTAAPTPWVGSTAEDEPSPGWLLPGLTGAGAVLAGAVLLAVRAHRRAQFRYRRPGQTIAPPPPELVRVEKTALVSGVPLSDGMERLDRLLRNLANNTIEADHGRLKARLRPMRGLKTFRSARILTTGHAFIQNLRRGHYEFATNAPVHHRVRVAFDELALAIPSLSTFPETPCLVGITEC